MGKNNVYSHLFMFTCKTTERTHKKVIIHRTVVGGSGENEPGQGKRQILSVYLFYIKTCNHIIINNKRNNKVIK